MPQDHWLPGFDFNVEEWDAKGLHHETLAICRSLALARATFEAEARRSLHDPQPNARRKAAPGRRLVSGNLTVEQPREPNNEAACNRAA
jgi:hypothetical protein